MLGTPNTLEYPDGSLAIVYPVARGNLALLDLLHRQLLERWQDYGLDTRLFLKDENVWAIAKAILKLIPSHPTLKLDPLKLQADHSLFESWVLLDDDKPGLLIQMQLYEPLQRKRQRKDDEPLTVADLPFPTSGNADCDTLANLISAFGVTEGMWLFENCSAEYLDKILFSWGELQRPGDDRVREYVSGLFFNMRESDDYRASMMGEW